jgi:hypothetical protein
MVRQIIQKLLGSVGWLTKKSYHIAAVACGDRIAYNPHHTYLLVRNLTASDHEMKAAMF